MSGIEEAPQRDGDPSPGGGSRILDWLRSVWTRAQLLAVRDSFIAEYGPEGGIEYVLIDTPSVGHDGLTSRRRLPRDFDAI